MRTIEKEYYGDQTRWFVATVIDGTPPYGLEGRVKVRIHGIHSENVNDIPQSDLPWAQVLMPGNFGGSSGIGGNCQILPGALVYGIFLDGRNSQLPMVIGSLPKTEYPTTVQAQGRDNPALNAFAYGQFYTNIYGEEPEQIDETVSGNDAVDNKSNVAVKFFIDNGYSIEQACGIVGVLVAVSNLDPEFDDGTRIGIAGWEKEGDRWARIGNFAKEYQPIRDVRSFDIQLIFVLHELRTTKITTHSLLIQLNQIIGNKNSPRVSCVSSKYSGTADAVRLTYIERITRAIAGKGECDSEAEKAYNRVVKT